MRYQERIYPQTNISGLRNREINTFNMSSDMCIFNSPQYTITGATTLDCTTLSGSSTTSYSHIITGETQTIPLGFIFTANTESFSAHNATFQYKVYPYEANKGSFSSIPVYTSESFNDNSLQNISTSGLTLDNEFIVKGFFSFSACTDYMGRLGKIVNSSNFVSGNEFGIYNKNFDYYFVALNSASTPQFNYNASNSLANGALQQIYLPINYYTIFPDIDQLENIDVGNIDSTPIGEQVNTMIGIPIFVDTPFILTLNGLVLAKDVDYTYSGGSIVYLNAPLISEDIVTLIFTSSSPNQIKNDVFEINTTIPSGATDGQGTFSVYYNTTTNKYEVFTSAKPIDFNSVLVMINGVVLANGIDFYQSTSNAKRIILNGDIILNDVITVSYFPDGVTGNIITENPTASWFVTPTPDKVNGYFTLEVATDVIFTNIVYTATTDYFVGSPFYSIDFPVSGYTYGDRLFYRVKNDKNYETICGNVINTFSYSETIPITIATNSINSY